jgi:hypothetical protein
MREDFMRRIHLSGLILYIIILSFEAIAYGQGRYEYKKRGEKPGIRMEGRDYDNVGGPGLELLSFLGYREEMEVPKNISLKIRFFLERDVNLFITAKELNVREFYKMKPLKTKWLKGWCEFGPWSMNEVLIPMDLTLNELGVIGRIDTTDRIGSGEIVPLIIYYSRLPENVTQYVLKFVPNQDLKKVEYKLYKKGNNTPLFSDQIIELFGKVPFPIAIDLSRQKEGSYKILLDCKYKNRIGGPQRSYIFYHKPTVKF